MTAWLLESPCLLKPHKGAFCFCLLIYSEGGWGMRIELMLEISQFVLLCDDENVNTFFEREHLNN
jgi:hypothetical protein